MKGKVFAALLFITIVLMLILTSPVAACEIQNTDHADNLSELGLFKGTNNGYELDKPATRVEILVMLIHLLGKEDVVLETTISHPFINANLIEYQEDLQLTGVRNNNAVILDLFDKNKQLIGWAGGNQAEVPIR